MASSNSTIQKQIKRSSSSSSGSVVALRKKYDYDVFVSFRGPDTRYSFIDYLYASFKRKGIVPFKDNKNVRKGQFIPSELCSAIQGSQIFIVVFSKNFAFSSWCLRELDQILYHALVYGKRVLTVFYDIDPSDVRHQKGSYAKAFQKHNKSFKHDLEMVKGWKSSLTQVANIAGYDLRHKTHHVEIEKITQEIRISLGDKFSGLPKDLVGIDSPLEELKERLLLKLANEVRVVGICGKRGVGKSTLANVLYDNISHEFEACCVIDDVSKMYKTNGPIGVQKQILRQTLNEEHLQVLNPYEATKLIRNTMRHLKTFVILDKVDQIVKLEKLGVDRKCFGAGSRIIIISRNEHVLNEYEVDEVYRVPQLNWTNSVQLLFCQKALKCDDITSHHERLARKMLEFTNGLPLEIKVLGSFLSTLHISEWGNALDRLNQRPNKNIIDMVQSKYQYYNGGGEIQHRSGHHGYVEQRYIEEHSLHLYPSARAFNPSFLMFNDENTASCSIL